MAEEKVMPDARELIMQKMDDEGRSIQWLSEKTAINYNTLHSLLRRKLFAMSKDNLTKINEALETNFTLNGTLKG
jgi:lambda repressor-like predicted transcriptional regulator